RAERLLAEVETDKQYPYQYVCYRVTDFRPESYPNLLIDGADLVHDLRLMIKLLVDPVITLDELSKQLKVSTKTIRRWGKLGLEGWLMSGPKGRRLLGFKTSVVENFLANYPDRVERGSRFSQLTEQEREDILCRAKRMARVGGTLTEISRRIARR